MANPSSLLKYLLCERTQQETICKPNLSCMTPNTTLLTSHALPQNAENGKFLPLSLQNQMLHIHNMLYYHVQAHIQSQRQYKVPLPLLHYNPNCWNSSTRWEDEWKQEKRGKGEEEREEDQEEECKRKISYQIYSFQKYIKNFSPPSLWSKFTLHYCWWPMDGKVGSWSWLLTKGRDQENYPSRLLVTSVKTPLVEESESLSAKSGSLNTRLQTDLPGQMVLYNSLGSNRRGEPKAGYILAEWNHHMTYW